MAGRFRLLTDEHFPNDTMDALLSGGWEVARVHLALGHGTLDEIIFAWAADHGFVWVTGDERALKWPHSYFLEGRPFVGMLIWSDHDRRRMRPGDFIRKLTALEEEGEPFAAGFRYIRTDR